VRRAVRYVRLHGADLGIDPNRNRSDRGSAGGHLALMLGTASDDGDPTPKDEVLRAATVAAVVAYFPPVDLRETNRRSWPGRRRRHAGTLRPLHLDMFARASVSPLLQVTPDDAPTLLVHGDKESCGRRRGEQADAQGAPGRGVPTDLIVIEGPGTAPGREPRRSAGGRCGGSTITWLRNENGV